MCGEFNATTISPEMSSYSTCGGYLKWCLAVGFLRSPVSTGRSTYGDRNLEYIFACRDNANHCYTPRQFSRESF